MKKCVALFLALVLLLCSVVSVAEGMDFASMSDDELQALVDGARNELAKRRLVAAKDTVLLDQDDVTVYLTGNYRVSNSGEYFYLEAVVVNDSDKNVTVNVDSSSINGWDVFGGGISSTSHGKKKKGEFTFKLEDAEISSYEEIEDLEMELYLYDMDEWKRISDNVPIALTFNAEQPE